MKVYILSHRYLFEAADEVLGVYATLERAQSDVDVLTAAWHPRGTGRWVAYSEGRDRIYNSVYTVEEYEVIDAQPRSD